jgi:hypothetical protein
MRKNFEIAQKQEIYIVLIRTSKLADEGYLIGRFRRILPSIAFDIARGRRRIQQ